MAVEGVMRVAWVVAYPVFGGPHNHLCSIAGALSEAGVEAIAVVPTENGNATTRMREGGVEVVQMPLHRMRAVRSPRPHVDFFGRLPFEVRALARLFKERQIDVVVQTTLVPPHGALAAYVAGLPVVWQIVDTRVPRPVRRATMAVLRRISDTTMFCGEALIDLHVEGRPLRMPVQTVFPPVNTSRFAPSPDRRAAVRERLGIPEDAPVVGQVGNLNPQKGWQHFVRAAGLVFESYPDAFFLMVGARYDEHRDYLQLLEAEMLRSGVPRGRFVMTGSSNEVESLLAAMDVALITSVPGSEGTPTAGLEALSTGVPVVASAIAAVPEFVIPGKTGALVPAEDHRAFGREAIALLGDDEARRRMGQNGRRMALEVFDAKANAEAHHEAFVEAAAHHRARLSRRRRLDGSPSIGGR